MVNYLSAECYKAFRRKYLYVFVGVSLTLAALFLFLFYWEGHGANATGGMIVASGITVSSLLDILSKMLMMGLYLLLIPGDIVFSEQYKHNTLKNEVSFGLARARIYLGKLVTAMLVAVVACTVLIGGYLGLSVVLFPGGETFGEALRALGLRLLVALPLWMGGLAFFHMLQFLMKGSTMATITYIMVVAVLGSDFLQLLSMMLPTLEPVVDMIRRISLTTPLGLLSRQAPEQLMTYAWTLGAAWFGVSTLIGLAAFRRKEIA